MNENNQVPEEVMSHSDHALCPHRAISKVLRVIRDEKINAVVAGGAAACAEKASDIDVFILSNEDEALRLHNALQWSELERIRDEFEMYHGKAAPTWMQQEAQPLWKFEDVFANLNYSGLAVWRVGFDIADWSGQIIFLPDEKVRESVDSLLMSFDLSCHMWALVGSTSNRVGCALSTEIDEPLWIRHGRSSAWTRRRATILAGRYGIEIANPAILDAATTNEEVQEDE